MKSRLFIPPPQSYFLFGPRGTGKSTFLSNAYPHAHTIDLLLSDNYQRYLAQPDRLLGICKALETSSTIVIDEVQRVPQLLSVVHHIMEERKDLQFVLTGSSSRKLKSAGVDLLAGRALRKELHPFMVSELGEIDSLEPYLKEGLLPLVIDAPQPQETLSSYLSLYINDEVKAEGLVRKVDAFARFLESMSFANAEQYNISAISRECGVSRTAVDAYLEILEDLLLCFTVPVFTARAKRKLVASRKFYFFDVGVYHAIRPKGPLDNPEHIAGAALETLVAQHLRAWIAYTQRKASLYYWRTQRGNEVDFILYGENIFSAFEIKNSARIRTQDFTGLRSFQEDYPEAKTFLLYRGDEIFISHNTLCIPVIQFLNELMPNHNPCEKTLSTESQ